MTDRENGSINAGGQTAGIANADKRRDKGRAERGSK